MSLIFNLDLNKKKSLMYIILVIMSVIITYLCIASTFERFKYDNIDQDF